MTTQGVSERHLVQENIEPNYYANEHSNEHASLLRAKE